VYRQASRLSPALWANSEAVRRKCIGEGASAEQIVTVHTGLDASRVAVAADWRREDALAVLGLPGDGARRFVSIVANLQHNVKDHPTFLRAAARVRERLPEAAFVLAGEGRLTEDLRAL